MSHREADQQESEHQQAFLYYCQQRKQEYHRIFGVEEPEGQIILAPAELQFCGWPGGGIYQFPPQGKLTDWHYVTEALSQPHRPAEAMEQGDPHYAFELVISTEHQCRWAPNVLMNIVRYLLSDKGRPIYHDQLLPCNGPLVTGWDTKLTYLLTAAAAEYDPVIHLPGGDGVLVHLVGVTEEEILPVLDLEDPSQGIRALYQILCQEGIGSCSRPERASVTDDPGFSEKWQQALSSIRMGDNPQDPSFTDDLG